MSAHAASLGKMTVLSSVGQPFNAEVELLFVSPDELDSLSVKLAPKDAFQRANINYSPALELMRFSIEKNESRRYIRITSLQPINEPNMGMLLDLSSSRGRTQRGYSVLLDPVKWNNLQSEASNADVIAPIKGRTPQHQVNANSKQQSVGTVAQPAAKPPAGSPAASSKEAPKQKEAEPVAQAGQNQTSYQVNQGDTLRSIVSRFKPDNVSLEQMLVATYRNNPDAFLNNNMNLLRLGATIQVPPKKNFKKTSDREARRIVREHTAAFNRYRNQMAKEVAVQSPPRQPAPPRTEPSRQSTGQITTPSPQTPPASQPVDRLELSKQNVTPPDNKATGAQPQVTQAAPAPEEKIALEKALEDANARVREMEKNVSELKNLLAIISKNAVAGPGAAPAPVPAAVPAPSPAAEGSITAKPPEVTAPKPPEKKEAPKPAPSSTLLDGFFNSSIWPLAIGGLVVLLPILGFVWHRKKKAQQNNLGNKRPTGRQASKQTSSAPVEPKSEPEKKKELVADNPAVISGKDFLLSTKAYTPEQLDELLGDEPSRSDTEESVLLSGRDLHVRYPKESRSGGSAVAEDTLTEDDLALIEGIQGASSTAAEETATVENVTLPGKVSEEIPVEESAASTSAGMGVEDMEAIEQKESLTSAIPEDEPGAQLQNEELLEDALSEEEPEVRGETPLDFDFTKINLDLETPAFEGEKSADVDMESALENAEVEAKLELALAYMGTVDKEGARQLLEEVIAFGTPTQISRAQEALEELM